MLALASLYPSVHSSSGSLVKHPGKLRLKDSTFLISSLVILKGMDHGLHLGNQGLQGEIETG